MMTDILKYMLKLIAFLAAGCACAVIAALLLPAALVIVLIEYIIKKGDI